MNSPPEPATVELVVTAPPPFGAELAYETRCRMTLGVLTELMTEAREYVVIAAPFLQPGYGLSGGPLSSALTSALERGVRVEIVSTGQSLLSLGIPRLADKGRVVLFQPKANLESGLVLGSHAKFCVADGEAAYIGSANLTGPGLNTQLEMGVFIKGPVARQIAEFWLCCVATGLFVNVSPPS